MKRLCGLFLLLFVLWPLVGYGQWRLQNPSKEDLFGVWGSSLKDLYVVGTNGTILHSQDNGVSFTQELSETKETLYGVGGSSEGVFVVGTNGTLLHSTDRGKTWLPRSFGARSSLRAVWASPEGDIFIVGEQGTILRSKDGLNWNTLPSNNNKILYSVWGNADGIYVVGEQGLILNSKDKGASWRTLNSSSAENLRGIWGDSAGNIFVVGYRGTILHSKDKGLTWKQKTSKTQEWLAGVYGFGGDVYAVGAQGLVLRSKDAGDSWTAQEAKLTSPIYGIIALSQAHVYTVGRKGNIAFLSPVKPLLVLDSSGDGSADGADAFIDERPLGKVPLSVEVEPGEHILQLKKEGYQSVIYTINLKEGDVYNLPVRAQEKDVAVLKALSSVVIEGPKGSAVFLNHEPQGTAPLTLSNVPQGTHVLTLKLSGYRPWTTVITVEGQNKPVVATLEKDTSKEEAVDEVITPRQERLYKISLVSGGIWAVSASAGLVASFRARNSTTVGQGGEQAALEKVKNLQRNAQALGFIADFAGIVAVGTAGVGLALELRSRRNEQSVASLSLNPTGASLQVKF